MKVGIIGVGGVGGYYGAKIAKAGFDVTFVARGKNYEALKKNGITIKGISDNFNVNPIKVTNNIKDIGKADLIILGVKAWQIKEILPDLKNISGNVNSILTLQNGVLAADELKEEIKPDKIIEGLCRIMSKIEEPGIINHFGMDPTIIFGEPDNVHSERILEIKDLFEKSGINSIIAEDIKAELWKKFIPICVSGLLAITRSSYGEIRELKETRKMMESIIEENYELSQKLGIKINPEFVKKTIAFIDTFPYDSSSSLSRDVIENKPSEIEYQNGTAVRLGEKVGLEMKVNRFVYSTILPMEKRLRKKV